jgi:hypothetical protein
MPHTETGGIIKARHQSKQMIIIKKADSIPTNQDENTPIRVASA